MSDKVAKITKVFLWVLMALTAFYAVMLFTGEGEAGEKWIGNALTFTTIVLIAAAGTAVLFGLYIFAMVFIARPKKALLSLIPIALLGIIFLIAYAKASGEVLYMPNYDGVDNVPGKVKWVGVGIIVTYIMLALAVVSVIVAGIVKIFK